MKVSINASLLVAGFAVFFSGANLAKAEQYDAFNLEIMGTVPPKCSIGVNGQHPASKAGDLDLSPNAPWQHVAAIYLSCNTGQSRAAVSYESMNRGLQHDNGALIDYLMNVTGNQLGADTRASDSPMILQQRVGPQTSFLRVRPFTNGLEPAGTYSDVIQINVLAN